VIFSNGCRFSLMGKDSVQQPPQTLAPDFPNLENLVSPITCRQMKIKQEERRRRRVMYVIRTLMKSEGHPAEELSLQRIEMTRSSGKASNKSHFSAISGDFLFLLRQGLWSLAESLLLMKSKRERGKRGVFQ
jgi:hypothetical protein